ncbi:protoheme IX farnesyltransferase [Pseudoflavitalea sp. G-6-1-2]|uniref:heme o synthase n=1 Tax=Pseudoflavitalea sp. G-6-1-2 TaxID=2728841 RepID=UPI001469F4CB|nr:heme o synthase [Pseudoflavitalea sp. G-6-1-2]NML19858.1 protoheme IX farnesyltransferase [Pseudoflavitalea sp. G-6-1-2]
MTQETVKQNSSSSIGGKVRDYMALIKFSLSFMVVFSAVISYLIALDSWYWLGAVEFFIAGMLVTGSANAVNQIVEKDTDALMKRTAKRPIPSGRMTAAEGWAFAIITLSVGLIMLATFFNILSAAVALVSWFIYAFMYTPLKKVSSMAVLLGAVPGALPCLIGWAAGADNLGIGGWVLFAIQFFWQFPHFWAIAWISHKDYSTAGFKLLPSTEGPGKFSAIQSIVYSLVLIPIGILPYLAKISGMMSLWIIFAANLFMVWQSIRLYREMEAKAARRVMFSSYIYLPVVYLAMLADKL